MRREHARLTSELKAAREQLATREQQMKQNKNTLRKRNDDILKLTKTLRALEGDQTAAAPSPSPHAARMRTAETTRFVGSTCRGGAGAARRAVEIREDEKLRDQIEELMANSAYLDEKLREERRLREKVEEDARAANATAEDKVIALRDEVLVCQEMVSAEAKDLRVLVEEEDSERSMLHFEMTGLREALEHEKKITSKLEDHLWAAREEAAIVKEMTVVAMEQTILQERRKYEELKDLYEEQARARDAEKKELTVAFHKIQKASQAHQNHAKEALQEASSARDSLEAMRRSHLLLKQETRALQDGLQQGLKKEKEGEMVVECLHGEMGNVGVAASENGENQVLKLEIEKLKWLLESKVSEILELRQHNEELQKEQEASTSAAGRERASLHEALVTVQVSHSSLLDCNRVRAC
jgi:hypothetical protein